MSLYNNNNNNNNHQYNHNNLVVHNNQHEQSNSYCHQQATTNGSANGGRPTIHQLVPTRSYHHIDGERSFVSPHTSSHLDMSVQLSRPVSKTVMLVRQRREMLEQISCYLCKGYLIDATTIDECMDSFCRSCIVDYLKHNYNCPKCGTLVHNTYPLSCIKLDKTLQDIVYKLVPGLYDNEMKRRRDFYRGLYGANASSTSSSPSSSSSSNSSSEDDNGLFNRKSFPSHLTGERYGVVTQPKPFYKPDDSIDLSIEPQTRGDTSSIHYDNKRQCIVTCFTGNQSQQILNVGAQSIFSMVDSQQFKTYLRCPAKFTAQQLKKFIATKFNICRDDKIHLLYLNESLKDEYSLIDIAYIYDWRGLEHMSLFYIIERDLTKNPIEYYNNKPATTKRAKPNSTSAGISSSTQTTKRVCIDPHPKFYDELNNNNSNTNRNNSYADSSAKVSSSGRSMRTRQDTNAMAPKIVIGINNKAPILRSSTSTATSTVSDTSRSLTSSQNQAKNATSASYNNNNNNISEASNRNSSPTTRQSMNSHSKSHITASRIVVNGNTVAHEVSKEVRGPLTHVTESHATKVVLPHVSRSSSIGRSLNQTLGINSMEVLSSTASTTGYSIEPDTQHNEISSVGPGVRQLVPYVSNRFTSATCVAGPSQSSMVTLASFTEARTGHVVAMSATKSSTISTNSYNDLIVAGSTPRLDVKSGLIAGSMSKPNPTSSELAFRFTKQQGVTIVQRLHNSDGRPIQSLNQSTLNINQAPKPMALPAPSMPCTSVRAERSNPSHSMSSHNLAQLTGIAGTGDGSSSSSNSYSLSSNTHLPSHMSASRGQDTNTSQSGGGGNSSGGATGSSNSTSNSGTRHHIKVKPVYKTFVDPTKLKSPNFKKLGYTARH